MSNRNELKERTDESFKQRVEIKNQIEELRTQYFSNLNDIYQELLNEKKSIQGQQVIGGIIIAVSIVLGIIGIVKLGGSGGLLSNIIAIIVGIAVIAGIVLTTTAGKKDNQITEVAQQYAYAINNIRKGTVVLSPLNSNNKKDNYKINQTRY